MAEQHTAGWRDPVPGWRLTVRRGEGGMWFATSEDEPPVFVAHTTLEGVLAVLPSAVAAAFSDHLLAEGE